jgi:phosphogluconate dehydratase
VAQVAGGVPAMCDGITQGRGGMELFSGFRETDGASDAATLIFSYPLPASR